MEVDQPGTNHRKMKLMKWLIATNMVILSVGYSYVYDIPGSLQDALTTNLHLSSYEFSLFYSIYSLPCIVFSMLGGYLIDSSIGLRKSTIIMLTSVVIGSIFYISGCLTNIFPLLVVGRFFLGYGLETLLGPCIILYTMMWFSDGHLNLIFSLTDNFCYIGTTMVYSFSNRLYELLKEQYPPQDALNILQIASSCVVLLPILSIIFIMFSSKSELIEEKTDKVRIFDLFKFPPSYWIVIFAYSTMLNAVSTFENFSQLYFMRVFGMTANGANNLVSIMYIIIIILAIPTSYAVDKFGRNLYFIITSIIIAFIGHLFLMFHLNPYFCMTMIGIAYAITASSIWSMVGYLLDESNYGLGYGVLDSFVNMTNFIFSSIAGKIIDAYGYEKIELFYTVGLACGLISLLSMWKIDSRGAHIINLSAKQRRLINYHI